ncbi:MAG: hypothetical protein EOM24_26985 [Chloroflexia bacterium]|nr:hypothetical protein [Chloroflexia bacterium]
MAKFSDEQIMRLLPAIDITDIHGEQYELPKNAHYREYRPGLGGRFADSFRAGDSLTEAAAVHLIGRSPEKYRRVKEALDARVNQYPPRDLMERAASFLGGATKQVLDPAGIAIAAATGPTWQVALGGGGYEAANSAMQNIAEGRRIKWDDAAKSGLAGAVGASLADAVGRPVISRIANNGVGGVIPEVLGRVLGLGVFGEQAEAVAGDTIGAFEKQQLGADDFRFKAL